MEDKYGLWQPEDEVVDYTDVLKKIWDNVIPQKTPYVKDFTTNVAALVKHIKRMGPYSMTSTKLKYHCKLLIDLKPLYEVGWDGNKDEEVPKEMFFLAYGKDYYENLQDKMRELASLVGLNVSIFDFDGEIDVKGND